MNIHAAGGLESMKKRQTGTRIGMKYEVNKDQ